MKPSPTAFDQIDHPMIIFGQLLTVYYLFQLFFRLRKRSTPLPQIIGIAAFSVLANVVARVMHSPWFVGTDIAQYWAWGITTAASVYSVKHTQDIAAKLPGAAVIVSDAFDRVQSKVEWVIIIGLGCVLVGYSNNLYMERTEAKANEQIVADSVKAETTAQFTKAQQQTNQSLSTIATGITSVSAQNTTIIANQSHVIKQNEETHQQIDQKSAQTRATVRQAVRNVRPTVPEQKIAPQPVNTETKEKERIEERKKWYQRLNPFGHRSEDNDDELVKYIPYEDQR